MQTLLRAKDYIETPDWTKEELETVLDVAGDLKRRFALGEPHRLLQDKTLFMMFFEQSTRTRNSTEAAMTQLGGHAHDLTPDKMQISHGETPKDTGKVLSRYGHGIAIRNCFYGIGNKYLREVAEHASIPVVSLQDDVGSSAAGDCRFDDDAREVRQQSARREMSGLVDICARVRASAQRAAGIDLVVAAIRDGCDVVAPKGI